MNENVEKFLFDIQTKKLDKYELEILQSVENDEWIETENIEVKKLRLHEFAKK